MKLFTHYIFLLLFFLLSVFSVRGQIADFSASVTSGCSPLVVDFTNMSTGATSFKWTFGNGDSSTYTGGVSTSYLTPGTYTVKLIAYSASGASSVHTLTITVYSSPTVNFVASETGICPGEPVTFSSTGSAGVSGAVIYSWNFGDGSSGSSASPTHVFSTPGYKNITLSVTNSQGCVATLVKGAYIDVYTPPFADFYASPTYVCNPPDSTSFTSTTTGPGPMSYIWKFGDGSTSTATHPTHTYSLTGSYSVELIATDGEGCKDTITKSAYITVGHLNASFLAPASSCVFSPVYFENTTPGSVVSSSWSFGDGGTSGVASPSYAFSTPGTYTVTLTVSNGYCNNTVSHIITIDPEPVSSFTCSPAAPCPAPATLSFTSSTPSGSSISWIFGDGATGSGTTATHTYTSNSIDTMQMIVTNTNGCKDTVRQIDTIYNLTVEISHIIDSSGCVPLTVPFSAYAVSIFSGGAQIPYPYALTSYLWNFGDGSPASTAAAPSHTYTAEGVYVATVTVVTANGCEGTATKIILVGAPPDPSFTAVNSTVCSNTPVIFTNTTPGLDSFSYFWNFGDNSTTSEPSPTHLYFYPDTGYTVTLYATYNGCKDSFIRHYYIVVDSPKAIMGIRYPCTPDNQLVFIDSSLGDNTHKWFFGDGTTSASDDTVHDYPALSTYTVMLTTYNTLSGCRDTAITVVNLTKPIPYFYANDSDICKNGIVHFTSSIVGGEAEAYYWDVNGIMQPEKDSVMSDTFTTTGIYSVMLIIKDRHSCFDSFAKPNYIIVAKPVDSFIVATHDGCGPLSETFTDYSSDVAGVTLTSFKWKFGDGDTASVSTTTMVHNYMAAGTYGVEEIVTDNIGCKDTLISPSALTVYMPVAAFTASNTHPCAGDEPISFTNLSTGIVSSFWMFGDDSTSSENSPAHIYLDTGMYTVRLAVTDAHGCTDTATYIDFIDDSKLEVSFYMPDSVTICLPFTVDFINTTTAAASYQWFFGDGSTSVLVSPTNLYTANGVDTVMLVGTNSDGCVDTAIGHVVLFGGSGGFSYGPVAGCAPLTVNFGAAISNIPNIVWDFADGNTQLSTYSDSASHTYTIPGAYVPKLVLSDNTGCEQSSQGLDTIKVDAVIPGFTTAPDPVCVNTTFFFRDTSRGYFAPITSQLWTFAPGDTSNLISPSYIYNDTGTFSISLHVTDSLGCKDSVTQDITVYPPPVITVSHDTTICIGDAAKLTGYGGVSYTWAPDASVSCSPCTTTSASPGIVTQYTVTGTDIHGCQNTDTTTVFLRTTTTSMAWGDTSICLDDAVPLSDTGATKFTWIPSEGLNDTNVAYPIATPSITTTYEVIAQLAGCIPDTNYVEIIVYPLPAVDAGNDQTLVAGSTAQLQATGTLIETYAWTPAESLNCSNCSNPVASMTVTTTYTVQVTSSFGCKSSDSVTIHLFCDKSQVFIPNTFTPNGDGQNDIFYPRGSGISLIKSFRIYNRWGELLFERSGIQINDASNAWDGSYNGGTPRPDVYVYIIDAVCDTGEPIDLKGDVTIIR